MSLPPSTIRIKRKLDEAPVRALYVDRSETKRQKVKKDFVFRLARTVTSPTDPNPPPFQPQPFLRPYSNGIPQVRSTLTPASRSRQVSPTLVSRTPSPHHAIGPLPAGSKLALDTAIGPRRTGEPRVPLSAIARVDSYVSVASTNSPAILVPGSPALTPTTEIVPSNAPRRESSDSDGPVRQGTFGSEKQHSLSGETGNITKPVPSPSTTTSKRKAAAAVRRYHLAKRLRIKHPHPYSTAATRRSAIFVRATSEPLDEEGPEADVEMDKVLPEELVVIRKRPRTHPEEKRQIEEERRKTEEERLRVQAERDTEEQNRKVRFSAPEKENVDPMILAMENMVLEYLNAPENAGIRDLPLATSPRRGTRVKSTLQQRIGGGLGGGSWKDMDRKVEIDEVPEAEEGFVYDVYIREELKEQDGNKEGEDYGLIIIDGSDDEEWWYEGDEEIDSDDVYGSDDDDSNAEDYHTNDYPEEPLYDSDAEGVDEFGVLGDSDEDGDDDDSDYENDGGMFRNWKKPVGGGEEEYDLEYDEDVDVEAEGMRRKMADIWGHREGHGVGEGEGESESAGVGGDSGDEMQD